MKFILSQGLKAPASLCWDMYRRCDLSYPTALFLAQRKQTMVIHGLCHSMSHDFYVWLRHFSVFKRSWILRVRGMEQDIGQFMAAVAPLHGRASHPVLTRFVIENIFLQKHRVCQLMTSTLNPLTNLVHLVTM